MPRSDPLREPASLDDLLLYRMSRVLAVCGSLVTRLCEGRYGITRREWRILALLALEEGVFSSQLAERAQLDRARTSKAVTILVTKKLIRREVQPSDRRQIALVLTQQGRDLYASMFPQVVGINQALLSALTSPEAHRLDKVLAQLQQCADDMVARAELPKADRQRGGRFRHEAG